MPRGFPLYTREEQEAGMDAIEDAADDQERQQAWKNYNAASPRGNIDRERAFNAGFAAGIRFLMRKRARQAL